MEIAYPGRELELFAAAHNWKAYLRRAIAPFLNGDVCEVGAGLGETARVLRPGSRSVSWTCLEPDPNMAETLRGLAARGELGPDTSVHCGTLADLPHGQTFDCVAYVDVLEHIEDDRLELQAAAGRLRAKGQLVVLGPAFPFLFSEFDREVGHFRRYTKTMLRRIAPPKLTETQAKYMDSVGFLASCANRLVLRQDLPSPAQIKVWDRLLVPPSRILDGLAGPFFGRSVLMVWTKS